MNYLLALETSGKAGSVALVDRNDPETVRSIVLPSDQGSAQSLVPCVDKLLRETGLESRDLGCIALISGPGSFTGLRVGVATAKTLGYALKIPIVELDTLDVIFYQFVNKNPAREFVVHSILDAYRGQLFVKTFWSGKERGSSTAEGDSKPPFESSTKVIDIDQFLREAMSPLDSVLVSTVLVSTGSDRQIRTAFTGPGCDRLKRYLGKEGAEGPWNSWLATVHWEAGEDMFPQASMVGRLGLKRWASKEFVDPFQLLPHYYRGSAAEEKVAEKVAAEKARANR